MAHYAAEVREIAFSAAGLPPAKNEAKSMLASGRHIAATKTANVEANDAVSRHEQRDDPIPHPQFAEPACTSTTAGPAPASS